MKQSINIFIERERDISAVVVSVPCGIWRLLWVVILYIHSSMIRPPCLVESKLWWHCLGLSPCPRLVSRHLLPVWAGSEDFGSHPLFSSISPSLLLWVWAGMQDFSSCVSVSRVAFLHLPLRILAVVHLSPQWSLRLSPFLACLPIVLPSPSCLFYANG